MTEQLHIRDASFEKIYRDFMNRYCGRGSVCQIGNEHYNNWIAALGLDDTKPYGSEMLHRKICESLCETFDWVRPMLAELVEDPKYRYYVVECMFPLTSMNGRTYPEEELVQAARTMAGKQSNLNHTSEQLPIVMQDAQWADKAVQVLAAVPVDAVCSAGNIVDLIDHAKEREKGIINVSIEADPPRATEELMVGLKFTGLGWLTKDTLPGVPLTRIVPIEAIREQWRKAEAVVAVEAKADQPATVTVADASTVESTVTPMVAVSENAVVEECKPATTVEATVADPAVAVTVEQPVTVPAVNIAPNLPTKPTFEQLYNKLLREGKPVSEALAEAMAKSTIKESKSILDLLSQ